MHIENEISQAVFEKLVDHVYKNADNNESYKNVNLICRYFALYGLPEFRGLRDYFVRLHREAEKTPCASIFQNREIGEKWAAYYRRWRELVCNIFEFLVLDIGPEKAARLKSAFEA